MLTDPDTYRARKERASGPADFLQRQILILRLVPSLAQAFHCILKCISEISFQCQMKTAYGNNVCETTYSLKL